MDPQIRILGGCALRSAEGRAATLPTRKSWGLLAYLCQSRGRDVPREELAALLWPRGSEGQARASLRQELAVLRRVLTGAGIAGVTPSKDRVTFTPPPRVVDTVEMERLLDRSHDRDAWRQAVRMYRGEFLADMNLRAGPFEEWLWLERQRLKSRILSALQLLLEHDLAGDDSNRAVATAEALLAVDPTQEQAHRAMMRLLRRSGRRAEALQLYERCRDILRRELDAEPSLETTMLADRIRAETGAPPEHLAYAPQRQKLAVLCAALTGPEDLPAHHDPEALAQAQQRFLQRAQQVIAACGGLILPGLDDRVVAVFGHPATSAEDCESAARSALSLVAEPVSLSARQVSWPRAAVATGEMLIAVPAAGRAGAVLAGGALLRATGLLQLARAGQVIVGADLPCHLNGHYATEPLSDLPAGLQTRGVVLRRASHHLTL